MKRIFFFSVVCKNKHKLSASIDRYFSINDAGNNSPVLALRIKASTDSCPISRLCTPPVRCELVYSFRGRIRQIDRHSSAICWRSQRGRERATKERWQTEIVHKGPPKNTQEERILHGKRARYERQIGARTIKKRIMRAGTKLPYIS